MTKPRGVEARINWFLKNPPNKAGMCARTCWLALGGSNGSVPAWGAPDANTVYRNVLRSGSYSRSSNIPRGALILWKYGRYGHAAFSAGPGKGIYTTDPNGRPGKTGKGSLTHPHKWGANSKDRIWTTKYNGVSFPVGPVKKAKPKVLLSKLHYGQKNSDSVKALKKALKKHFKNDPDVSKITTSGNYGKWVDHFVRKDQRKHGFGNDAKGKSHVGRKQAAHLGLRT